jgi:hypothetical protein
MKRFRRATYRPSPNDHFPQTTQKLSCHEGGKFDALKHHVMLTINGKPTLVKKPATAWTVVCHERATAGISRRARIEAKRAAA